MLTFAISETILALTGPALPRHHHLPGRKLLTTLWGFLYVLVRETPHLFMSYNKSYRAFKTPREAVTPEYIRECFEYDPDTGELTWKSRPRNHFPTERGWRIFHKSYAGKVTGCMDHMGYLIVLIGGRPYPVHRVILALVTGAWPTEMVDHINGVRHDNRLVNLRAATREENRHNTLVRKDSSTGVKGVGKPRVRADGSLAWRASITAFKVKTHIGYFPTKEQAAAAIREARKKIHREFAHHG